MSRKLDDLSDAFRPIAFELLARCTEAGLPVLVVDTLRTSEEHQANLARGVSWTNVSKHLDGATFRDSEPGSDAIDLCPYATYQLHGADKLQWDGNDPVWQQLGVIGKSLGLIWGGEWTKKDLGHFELRRG